MTNALSERIRTTAAGLVHFAEHGWRAMLPMSEAARFDVAFYNDLAGRVVDVAPQELYRRWVEVGLPKGAAANERQHFLELLGLELTHYPRSFDWRCTLRCILTSPSLSGTAGVRCCTLQIGGALDGRPLPISAGELPTVLLAIADRAVLAGRNEVADRLFDRLLVQSDLSTMALQHAADHANRSQRYGEALAFADACSTKKEGVPFWTITNGARLRA